MFRNDKIWLKCNLSYNCFISSWFFTFVANWESSRTHILREESISFLIWNWICDNESRLNQYHFALCIIGIQREISLLLFFCCQFEFKTEITDLISWTIALFMEHKWAILINCYRPQISIHQYIQHLSLCEHFFF